ncbi:PP2C family protein-serine/threonine phosphatase [Streptomyces sp. NPDC090106]|uniref:PP2C family protein-serine/threonine phosphatase n=1 Tax=Streptomyces sp. NPDC090106 TaxID=3365946 RepID=UPI0037F6E8BB
MTRADAPYPVLVVDRTGGLVRLNEAARLLLDEAGDGAPHERQVPSWLTEPGPEDSDRPSDGEGPRDGTRLRSGFVNGRFYEAHRTLADNGDALWWLIDCTDRRLAETALRDARLRSEVLSEVSNALLSTLNVPRCMEVAATMAAEHLAEAAVLVAPPQGRRFPLTYAHRGGPVTQTLRKVDVSGVPGLSEALQGFPPVPARWIDPAHIPQWVIPDGFEGPVGSVIVAPLPGHGVPAGALILLRSSTERAFTSGEEVFARLFAARAGAALSAARLYTEQTSIAATLMRDLLPPALQHVHGVEYAGRYRASKDHEQVGGDFYDVHPGPDPSQETLVVLGDVAGKGLDAAVLTGKIRNTLHALLPLADDHGRVLELLNGSLLSSHHTRFATVVLASVRHRPDRVELRLTSAGHPPPLIVRLDGTVEEVPTHGTLVGAVPTIRTHTVEAALAPGETCLLYTDGVIEARGGPLGDDFFGEHRLRRALADCGGMPAEAVVERVQMLATQWVGGGRHDDMAVVAVSAPKPSSLTVADAFRELRGGADGEGPR